jgi:transposase InsO family protein
MGKRTGEVFASASTWGRVIQEFGLLRPKDRMYPVKLKIGIRASMPNQIWHIDMTIIKMLDGTRTFTQSIIDNYSRYVLAHFVSTDFGGVRTKELIKTALNYAREILGDFPPPTLLVDSGVENINRHVDTLVEEGLIHRVIAQIDISFSNSMIECFFRRLKHGYLYLHKQGDLQTLIKHINFYVKEHNVAIPHSSLSGATPFEVFQGSWNPDRIVDLRDKYQNAIQKRCQINSARKCANCLT